MTDVTLTQLMHSTGAEEGPAIDWLDAFNEAMDRFEINTPLRQAAFLAQCGEETGGLRTFTENLNYSEAALLRQWPKRFSHDAAAKYGRNASHPANIEMIANLAYGGRFGNAPGEGWKWRGRGPMQLTFYNNYLACGKGIDVDLTEDPDLLFEPEEGAASAAWFFHKSGCNELADDRNFTEITQRVNGGQINADKRMQLYTAAKTALGI